jgi:autophagy-related protein 16
LTKDNAKLLQRWLDAKQAEANKMNEANDFYETMRSKHQAVLNWRDEAGEPRNGADTASQASVSVSGKADALEKEPSTETKDGMPSPAVKDTNPIPNG